LNSTEALIMIKISNETRLYVTIIGLNLILLNLFFLIITLLKFYEESPTLIVLEISIIILGIVMIFVGLKGFKPNNSKMM